MRDVAAIVERVDRLPLGIELAAGVARAPSALARARPARHRTLEAVVEWSFDQLSYDERTLFRRLAPFAGGWTLEAAIATAGFQPLQNEDVPGLLAVLANRSLVVVEAGGARYRMLETIAAYAAARLRGADDERIARDRHLAYFREAAEQWDARALREPWPAVLAAMTPELVNCSAALAWAFSDGHPADGARLISSLVILTAYGRVLPKADQWLARASECDLSDPGLRGRVEHAIAVQTMFDGAPREAIGHERLAVSALRESGDLPRLARALAVLARLLYNVDEAHEAIAVGGEALAIAAAHGLRPLEASILGNLDVHYRAVDERVTAAECSERARAICREIGDRHLFAAMTGNRSVALYEEGRYDEAVVLARQAVELAGALQDERFLAWQLMNVGSMEIRRHNFAAAREVLLRALPMNVACEDPVAVASTVLHLAEVALAGSDARRALQLYACAEALRGDRFALQPNMAAIAERLRDRLNATFGDAVVAESVEAAPRAMSHALRLGELG